MAKRIDYPFEIRPLSAEEGGGFLISVPRRPEPRASRRLRRPDVDTQAQRCRHLHHGAKLALPLAASTLYSPSRVKPASRAVCAMPREPSWRVNVGFAGWVRGLFAGLLQA